MLHFLIYLVACSSVFVVHSLPPGFTDEGVGRFQRVTDIADLQADGTAMLLVSLKQGQLELIMDPDNNPTVTKRIADFSSLICINGERGLQSVIAHPNFNINRHVYVYYTYKGDSTCQESTVTGPVNRCVRYTLKADFSVDLDSEYVMFQTTRLAKRYHNGGDMVFGHDGHLYIATGDGGTKDLSQDTTNLLGSLLRLDGNGDIPSDNPFSGSRCAVTGQGNSPCSEIFSYGFRNPFKMALDPNEVTTTRLMINDVGGQTWEEANLAGTGYAGRNYGWPEREGPCRANGEGGNNVEDCRTDSRYQDPEHYYQHRQIEGTSNGGAIVGGAFLPNGHWPAMYDNSYFFADFVFEEIYRLSPTASGCRACSLPTSNYRNETFQTFETISAVHIAPYKNTIAMYYGKQRLSTFTMHRIVFVGGVNNAPIAVISASETVVLVGESISFSGRLSDDADGDLLEYGWDFGDGSASTGVDVSHSYQSIGEYTVSLTVEDGNGGVNTVSAEFVVGVPPTVSMQSPVAGARFAVGEIIELRGSAVDAFGNSIDETSLEWEVRQHHATHFHPFLSPTKGFNVPLHSAPSPEDFLAATNSHLEILLTATDRNGLRNTVSRLVMPKTVWLDFDTNPTGIDIYLDDFRIETPQRILSWENHTLKVTAPDSWTATFQQWSDGSNQSHILNVPAATDEVTILIATYSLSWSTAWLDFLVELLRRLVSFWGTNPSAD